MVAEGLQEDMGEANMQCSDHPYKTNTAGGICAFCLQEKLGKLVSSSASFPVTVFPSSSPSSSPSFRSDYGGSTTATLSFPPNASTNAFGNSDRHNRHCYSRRPRIPFLLTQNKKKKKDLVLAGASDQASVVFKRSKSVAAVRRGWHLTEADENSPRRRWFWSFLYLSKHASNSKIDKHCKDVSFGSSSTMGASSNGSFSQRSKREEIAVVDENESPIQAAFDRKVSRSRSVGCGSRSFSGDFFERISTGFGDCTLRRVESQREGKPKITPAHRCGGGGQDCIKERVKCGGIFSGFMVPSSSSSSSSSSYLVSSSAEDNNINGKTPAAAATPAVAAGHLAHGRSKSWGWGWALASPMRAFNKPSSRKREASNKNATPNLNAIPSLLAVGG